MLQLAKKLAAASISSHLKFDGFETEKFPENECTVQNKKDPEVFDAKTTYLCILPDNHTNSAYLRLLHPYINKFEGEVLYGWTDDHGNIYDHKEKTIHDDDIKVESWKKVTGGSIKSHLDFSGFESKKFPEKECTKQNKREPEVFDADTTYFCVAYQKGDDYAEFVFLHPYIWKDEGKEVLYGWVDDSGNVYDHKIKPATGGNISKIYEWKKI